MKKIKAYVRSNVYMFKALWQMCIKHNYIAAAGWFSCYRDLMVQQRGYSRKSVDRHINKLITEYRTKGYISEFGEMTTKSFLKFWNNSTLEIEPI
jgi:hypothetical protein